MRSEFANVESVCARLGWPRHGQVCKDKARDASAASTRLRSVGRRWDKAARGRGPSCACNAAAFVLPAHLLASPRQQPGGEERGACLSPPGGCKNGFVKALYEATFSPPGPASRPHARPGRKADPHFGMWHAGRTPGKERAACVDAEISILMQHNAENK